MSRRWKLIGLAGLAGVAATGVVVARKRREHVEYDPDELRAKLHDRLADVPVERQRRRADRRRQRTRKLSRTAAERLPAVSVARIVSRWRALRRPRGSRMKASPAGARFVEDETRTQRAAAQALQDERHGRGLRQPEPHPRRVLGA